MINKILNTTPKQWLKKLGIAGAKRSILTGPGIPLVPDARYFANRDVVIQGLMSNIEAGATLEESLIDVPAKEYDERVVEYAYLTDWVRDMSSSDDLLDVGCVLNNRLTVGLLKRRCRAVWFCNPAIESPLYPQQPVYYHVSPLSSAFPGGMEFSRVTCLSTIEHIGYDNSHYGVSQKPEFTEPNLTPFTDALQSIGRLCRIGGKCLISVPYGKSETIVHPLTGKKCLQVFDHRAIQNAVEVMATLGLNVTAKVFEASRSGWKRVEPKTCMAPYANGVPAAGAVLVLDCTRER